MNTAQFVLATIKNVNPSAVTLCGGYMIARNGARVTFEPAHVEKEKRNAEGRCTMMEARFKDGSGLQFRWSEKHGAGYTLLAQKEMVPA